MSALSRISGIKPVELYVELSRFLILLVTPLKKKPQQTNQTKQTTGLDIWYHICLLHCLQFSRGINPYTLLVLNIFCSKETIYKTKSLIFLLAEESGNSLFVSQDNTHSSFFYLLFFKSLLSVLPGL